jgi:hypothetical protein
VGADAQCPRRGVEAGSDIGFELRSGLENAAAVAQNGLAGRRQASAPRPALEQAAAAPALELGDLGAEGRLGQVQLARRGRDAPEAGHRPEVIEMVVVQAYHRYYLCVQSVLSIFGRPNAT